MLNNLRNISESILKKTIKNTNQKRGNFVEIKCPLDNKKINSTQCKNCKFCQIKIFKHISNRNLTSMICLYKLERK